MVFQAYEAGCGRPSHCAQADSQSRQDACPIRLKREGARLALKSRGGFRLLSSFPLCLPGGYTPLIRRTGIWAVGADLSFRRCVLPTLAARLIRNRLVGKGFQFPPPVLGLPRP